MNDEKILVIIQSKEQANMLIPYVKDALRKNSVVVVLALDYGAQDVLRKEGIPYVDFGKFLGQNNMLIDITAWKMANTWGEINEARQKLLLEGVFLGDLLAYELTHLLTDLILKIEVITQAIKVEKPTIMLAVDDKEPSKRLPMFIAKTQAIPMLLVNQFIPSFRISLGRYVKISFDIGNFNFTLHVTESVWRLIKWLIDIIGKIYLSAKNSNVTNELQRQSNKKKLLMLDFNVLEFDTLLKKLVKEGYSLLLINERRPSGWCLGALRKMCELRTEYKTLGDYSTKDIRNKTKDDFKILFKKWKEIASSKEVKEFFTYKGVSLLDIAEKKIDRLFANTIYRGIYYILTIKRLIQNEQVKAIVGWNDSLLFERSAFLVGKEMGIPSLVIQHGVTGHPILNPIIADKYAVWGEISRDWFIRWGNDPKKIEITGNPKFVKYSSKKCYNSRELIFRKLKIPYNKKLVIFASQPIYGTTWMHWLSSLETAEERRELLKLLFDTTRKLKNIYLIVKLHPMEDYAYYKRVFSQEGIRLPVNMYIDLYELLNACDLLITVSSTVGLEAMVLGKPVITINLTKRNNLNPYQGSGAVIEVRKAEQLSPAIQNVLYNVDTKQKLMARVKTFLHGYLYERESPVDNIVNIINKMTS